MVFNCTVCSIENVLEFDDGCRNPEYPRMFVHFIGAAEERIQQGADKNKSQGGGGERSGSAG